MACVLYDKDGNALRCEIGEIEYHLQNGYQKNHPDRDLDEVLESEIDKLEDEIEKKEAQIDAREDEVRALAKSKGVKSWHVKSIDNLLKELDELEAEEDAAED